MKHKLLKTLTAVAFCASLLGAGLLSKKSVSAETATAEWAVGNEQVSVTMNFDVQNSDYAWWAFTQADSNHNNTYNNAALQEADMWYKTNYVGLKPMLYTAPKLASGNPTINLGYYDGDFKMTSSPANAGVNNSNTAIEFYGVEYKFTDIVTGEYFTVRAESTYAVPNAKVTVTANGDTGSAQSASIAFSFITRTSGNWNQSNGALNPFSLKYDTESNAIVTNRNMSTSLSLASAGLESPFDTYTVDMSFVSYRLDTAHLLVYSLNGLDLCGATKEDLGDWHNTVIMQKTPELVVSDGSQVNLGEVFGAWDAIRGDVTNQIEYSVKDPFNQDLEVTDGEVALTTTGIYTVTCSVGTATKTMTVELSNHLVEISQLRSSFFQNDEIDFSKIISVQDTVDGDIFDEANITLYGPDGQVFEGTHFSALGEYRVVCEVENYKGVSASEEYTVFVDISAQEWATGNESVTVIRGYDITNSHYGEGGDPPGYWRIRAYDSNMITPYNTALKREGFWTKNSYLNLKPMFYETLAEAEAPSLKLGYYAGDFGMAFTPVQSVVSNTYAANVHLDYYGVIYTFTDILSGNYFQVKIFNPTNIDKYAKISVSVNGGDYSAAKTYHGSFGGRYNGAAGNANEGVFYMMNIKYDATENKIKYNRDLSDSFDLSELGLDAFAAYTVDMSFDRIQADKTAKLCVYYLNGYDLTKDLTGQDVGSQILVEGKLPEDVLCGTTITLPKVSVWDAVDGNILTSALQTRVIAPDNSTVTIANNAFTVTQEGKYTIEYSVVSETNGVTTVKTHEFFAFSSIPFASLILSENLVEEIGVGGTLVIPTASFEFQGKTESGWVVVERNGRIVAGFNDSTVVNKLKIDEVGSYRVSYVYESKFGYMNAFTYKVNAIETLVIVDPALPERFVIGAEGYEIREATARLGNDVCEGTFEIIAPSGKTVELNEEGLFIPEELGTYRFIYRAQVGEQSVEEVYEVNAEYSAETLFIPNASIDKLITDYDARFVLNEDSNGVAVVANSGGEVRFANVVDLSSLGKTPIIEFQPLTKSDGYGNLKTVIVTLTDIHDTANVVKIKWALNLDNFAYVYLSVNAGGNGYYGLRNDGYVFKNQYGANKGCSFYVDQYDPQYLSNICIDFQENQFLADLYNGYPLDHEKRHLTVIDADDINQVGDGYQWKGFTTGEVYLSLSLPDATNGGVIITSIAGQSLAGKKIVDTVAPTIVVNTEKEYLNNGMPEGVTGMEYPLPTAVARDLISAKTTLAFHIEYKNNDVWEEVALVNGKFIPERAGEYKLVWTAKDVVGNEGKKEFDVTVKDEPNDINIEFSRELLDVYNKLSDIYVGDKVYIPAIKATGGNGKVAFTTEWLFNDQAIQFNAPSFYLATEIGTLTARVTATDYLGNIKTQDLSIEIKTPEKPVLEVLDVPTSVVKGKTLVLPDFTATDYTYGADEDGYNAERKIYVNGQEIDLTSRTYEVTENAGSVLTVQYVGIGRNGQTEKTYSIYVIEPKFIGDYLIYDAATVSCELNKSYTELSACEDFTVKMPNPVSVQDMIICFYADKDHLLEGGTVSVLMTDMNDPSTKLKITAKLMDDQETVGLYLNKDTTKLLPLTSIDDEVYFIFNSFSKEITNAVGKKILNVEYDLDGRVFAGFESGAAHISFTVNDVTEKTSLRLNQVGNQRFLTTYKNDVAQEYVDNIAPQVSYAFAMNSTSVKRGESVAVASAKAFDVLQNTAIVTVTVESPSRTLYSNVAIDESFSFVAEEYGYYTITYTVRAGGRTTKLPSYYIKVKDETAPTLTVEGEVAETCAVGKTLALPSAKISDDGTSAEDLKFFVFVIEPRGRYVNVTGTMQYQVAEAGKYTVVYYLVDNDYNVARQEYVVIAK